MAMAQRTRTSSIRAAVVAFALLATACGGGDTTTPPPASPDPGQSPSPVPTDEPPTTGEGELVIGMRVEPTDMDSQVSNVTFITAHQVHETLYIRETDGSITPHLASGPPVLIDDLTWEIPIRDGVTFSDGRPFDAAAAAASFQRLISFEPADSSQRFQFRTLESAEASGPSTLRLTTTAPDPILPARLTYIYVVDAEAAEPDTAPVGTGPFVFDSWQRGQAAVLARNDNYWGEPTAVTRIEFRFIPDAGARLAGLLAGELDLVTQIQPEDTTSVPDYVAWPSVQFPLVVLSTQADWITNDPNVRRALNLAIDKNAIADLFGGFADVVPCQYLLPGMSGYSPNSQAYDYDPEGARTLLEEAGATGTSFSLVASRGNWLKDAEMAEAVAGFWEAVGVDVDLQITPYEQWIRAIQEDDTPGSYLAVRSMREFDASGYEAYFVERSPANKIDDPDFEQLMATASPLFDPAERHSAYQEAVEYFCDAAHGVFLVSPQDIYGTNGTFDFEPSPLGENDTRLATITFR